MRCFRLGQNSGKTKAMVEQTATEITGCSTKVSSSGACRIAFFHVHAKIRECLLRLLGVEFAFPGQPGKSRRGDGFGINLKVPPQVFAVVTASKAVCS